MDFRLTSDQDAVVSAIDKLATQFESKPTEFHGFALTGAELEQELTEAQYFDIAQIPELGPLCAAMAVERLARLPYTAEIALSMLVRPHLPGEWPRPLALVESSRPGRFVATAKTVLIMEGDELSIAQPAPDEVESVESLFAYPMGRLKDGLKTTQLSGSDAACCRRPWPRLSITCRFASSLGGRSVRSRPCAIGWQNAPCWRVE
jgi:hypothetical protein